MIETDVPGDVADVEAAARWLRTLLAGTAASGDLVQQARGAAGRDWEGRAGDAYAGITRCAITAADDHEARVRRAVAVVEEYAARLAAVQSHMADVRARAAAGGLAVHGTVVASPGALVDATPRELERQALHERLASETHAARAEHERWVAERLGSAADDARVDGAVGALVDALVGKAAPFLTTAGVVLGAGLLRERVEGMVTSSADARARADGLRRDARSGHPGRRAAATTDAARGQRRALQRAASEAAGLADDARRASRVLGPVGTAIEVAYAADAINDGGSPGGTLLATGTGMGVAGLVVVGTAGAPVVATALLAGGAAVVASEGVKMAWNALPDRSTDAVDEALDGAWDATTGTLEDGVDAVQGWFR